MGFWKQIFGSPSDRNVKRKYHLGQYTIVLSKQLMIGPNGRASNIAAFDTLGALKWVAETPHANFSYYDMQIDENELTVIGENGAGTVYTISLEDGSIIGEAHIK